MAIKVCVHYFYVCHQNKTFNNLAKIMFVLSKKLILFSRFLNFVLPSSSLFSFLGHCWFYGRSWLIINSKVYDIFMSLNWILKIHNSLMSGETKFWSWCLVIYLSEYYVEKCLAFPRPTFIYHVGKETVSLTQCWSMHFISYDPMVTQILSLRSQSMTKHIIRVWT